MSVIATIGMPRFLDIDFIVVPFFPLYDEHSGHLFFFTLESSYGAEPMVIFYKFYILFLRTNVM